MFYYIIHIALILIIYILHLIYTLGPRTHLFSLSFSYIIGMLLAISIAVDCFSNIPKALSSSRNPRPEYFFNDAEFADSAWRRQKKSYLLMMTFSLLVRMLAVALVIWWFIIEIFRESL